MASGGGVIRVKVASGSTTPAGPHVPKRVYPPSRVSPPQHLAAGAAPIRVSPPQHLAAHVAPQHIEEHDRCAFAGDVPRELDEPHIKRLVEEAGYARPTRAIVRASTGKKAGYFALLYFETVEEAVAFKVGKAGNFTWPGGIAAEVRLV